jgi:uncharacterized protein YfaP (DUF2135 family)
MNFKKQALWVAAGAMLTFAACCFTGCETNHANIAYTTIKGKAGWPRFNLQFTTGASNDVDLYVITPDGSVINYKQPLAQNGSMDMGCLCGDCPHGANENIYWSAGTAPKGKYTVWAQYFDPCVGVGGASNYVIRIIKGTAVLKKYEGVVSTRKRKSPVYTFVY